MRMNCEDAIELLPWMLNGTLDAGEHSEVRRHLEACEPCRQALRDTRQAWTVFDQHLAAEALVALAYGEPPAGLDSALAERHLASCPQCAADLELARMSRRLDEDDRIAVFPPRPAQTVERPYRVWRASALAAGLAGVVALSGWFQSSQQLQRVPELEARNQQIQQEKRRLESQLAAVAQREPQINTWTDSVYQQETERGSQEREEIVIPSTVEATAMLVADLEISAPLRRIEIVDESGKTVWSRKGLRRHPETNDFTVTLFPGFLKPGHRYTIRLSTPDGQPAETYPIRVEVE